MTRFGIIMVTVLSNSVNLTEYGPSLEVLRGLPAHETSICDIACTHKYK